MRRLAEFGTVVLLLLVFAWMADTGMRDKCATFDEVAHLTAGYSYWRVADSRLHPENGMLPQRWAALPTALQGATFVDLRGSDWEKARLWSISHEFFFGLGNDPDRMLRSGRRMILVFATALGVLVYAWSRTLFGATGGLISLGLYAFCPSLLAHGSLATSDVVLAFFLLAAVGATWRMLRKLTPTTLVCGAGTIGLLFLSKSSAFLFVPMWILLAVLRIGSGEPIELSFGGPRRVTSRWSKFVLVVSIGLVQAVLTLGVIWAFHGFRYASGADVPMEFDWERVANAPSTALALVEAARDWKLLPESYLYGIGHVLSRSQARLAFLSGEVATEGWWYFFPYAFLVKTPLATLAVLAFAGAAIGAEISKRPEGDRSAALVRGLYSAAPLLVLLGVYGTASLYTHLNIGHRHILPLYPALMILAGAAGLGAARWRWKGRVGAAVLLAALVVESGSVHPHYLAFFNRVVGGPSHGYRHLVDSSLDWGQDLPGLASWLARERERGETAPVYLSYFGMASPEYYGISARSLPGFFEASLRPRREFFPLEAGIYAISATMLQNLYVSEATRGRWTHERQAQFEEVERRLVAGERSNDLLSRYAWLRFARLTAYLREREPDVQIGYSINVYRLSDEQARAALYGPLRELEEGREGSAAVAGHGSRSDP